MLRLMKEYCLLTLEKMLKRVCRIALCGGEQGYERTPAPVRACRLAALTIVAQEFLAVSVAAAEVSTQESAVEVAGNRTR